MKAKTLFLILSIAFTLSYIDFCISFYNSGYDSPYNGFGSIESVLNGTAKAPMQYRVLFPWLYGTIKDIVGCQTQIHRLVWIYEPLKMLMVFLGLWGIYYFFSHFKIGLLGTLVFSSLIPLTFLYDYPDQFLEMALLSWGFIWILKKKNIGVITFAAVLNRETAFLILPVLNLFAYKGEKWKRVSAFVGGIFGLMLPRIAYGSAQLYSDFWQISRNLNFISKIGEYPQTINRAAVVLPYFNPTWFFIPAFGLLFCLAIKRFRDSHTLLRVGFILMFFYIILGFCCAMFGEIRIFSWFYLILIPMVFKKEEFCVT